MFKATARLYDKARMLTEHTALGETVPLASQAVELWEYDRCIALIDHKDGSPTPTVGNPSIVPDGNN
jgi:hypothetical protein